MSPDSDRGGHLYRAVSPEIQVVRAADGGQPPILSGHFAVFDEPTLIDSFIEGTFIERIAPGAFKKTFRENGEQIKVLFQHGCDPNIADKPLGPISELREDGSGAFYEVPLLDTDYVSELIPGLRAGLYGASFCFRAIKEEFNEDPGVSAANPKGLPERTIQEAQVLEFGPVTFPVYAGATAGVRSIMRGGVRAVSLTDRVYVSRHGSEDELVRRWAKRNPERAAAVLEEAAEERAAIPYQHTATTDVAWDGPAARAALPSPLPVETARKAFAWIDESRIEEGNVPKDACKFIHHEVSDAGDVGAANTNACSTGIGVLNGAQQGTTIPDAGVQGVYDHLAHHLRDAGQEPPELKRAQEPVDATTPETPAEEAGPADADDQDRSTDALPGAEEATEPVTPDGAAHTDAPLYGARKSEKPSWLL